MRPAMPLVAVAAAVVVLAACGAGDPVDTVTDATADTCALARPDFGGPATAADRALFAYDASAPLDLKQTVDSTRNGVELSTISFGSPGGGSVPGIMARPVGRPGPRPGIVVMHPSSSPTLPVTGARLAWSEAVP